MAKKVVVVRVGTETIRIVHMDNTPDNPTVYGCVRVPTPQGAVEDGEVKTSWTSVVVSNKHARKRNYDKRCNLFTVIIQDCKP